jgi:hypothetical protein
MREVGRTKSRILAPSLAGIAVHASRVCKLCFLNGLNRSVPTFPAPPPTVTLPDGAGMPHCVVAFVACVACGAKPATTGKPAGKGVRAG